LWWQSIGPNESKELCNLWYNLIKFVIISYSFDQINTIVNTVSNISYRQLLEAYVTGWCYWPMFLQFFLWTSLIIISCSFMYFYLCLLGFSIFNAVCSFVSLWWVCLICIICMVLHVVARNKLWRLWMQNFIN
jgi:hypothetical protein